MRGPLRVLRAARHLLVAGAAAAVAAGLLAVAGGVHHASPGANRALVDRDATTKVIGDVGTALTEILSYTPGGTAQTGQAADRVLTGNAAGQYRLLFAQVTREAPAQGLTLTTRVVRAGLRDLTGNTAHLLVFLDQVAGRRGRPNGPAVAAQLSVTARYTGGHWLISDIQAS